MPLTSRSTSATPAASAERQAAQQRQIETLAPWFHNLHLPSGEQTLPRHFLGGDFPNFKWQQIQRFVPADLHGWRVLDVGCNAGFYSFELARRGASVLGIDVDAHYLAQARWALGEMGLQSRVEFRQMEVYDLARSAERFDLVWFMGVFYHLRYPLLALDLLAARTRRLMMFQTLTMPGSEVHPATSDCAIEDRTPLLESGWPKMAFIEHRLAGDPTNWWAANHAAVEAMLRSSGLRVIERPGHEMYLCAPENSQASHARRALYDSQFRSIFSTGERPSDAPAALPGPGRPGDEAPPGTPGTGEGICRDCGGRKVTASGAPCPTCGGTGHVTVGVGGG